MQFSTPRENNREREEFKIRVIEGRSSSTMLSTSDVGIGSVVSLPYIPYMGLYCVD